MKFVFNARKSQTIQKYDFNNALLSKSVDPNPWTEQSRKC